MPTDSVLAPSQLAAPAVQRSRVALILAILAVSGFAISSFAHATGLPVRVLLPMHWTVLAGGLAFGWRAGLLLGLLTPAFVMIASGLPNAARVAPMAVELATYGAIAGLGAARTRQWRFVLAALIGGRLAWALVTAIALSLADGVPTFALLASLLPGLPIALAQLALIPVLARTLRNFATPRSPAL